MRKAFPTSHWWGQVPSALGYRYVWPWNSNKHSSQTAHIYSTEVTENGEFNVPVAFWPLETMGRGFGRLQNPTTTTKQPKQAGPRLPRPFAWAVVVCGVRLGAEVSVSHRSILNDGRVWDQSGPEVDGTLWRDLSAAFCSHHQHHFITYALPDWEHCPWTCINYCKSHQRASTSSTWPFGPHLIPVTIDADNS